MHWIIQSSIYHETGINDLLDILSKFQLPHSLHKIIPFIGDIEPDINPTGKVICIGSYSLRHLAKKKGWNPGVYDICEQNFLIQQKHWGELLLNYDAIVGTFSDVQIPEREPFFTRPISDSKNYPGTLYDPKSFREWQENLKNIGESSDGSGLNPNTLVMIASPKEIYAEYRLFVVNRKIVTGSLYKRGSVVKYEEYVPAYIITFAEKAIEIWQPHKAFVIDIAETPHGLKIIEINTLNSAGLYAANVSKLVTALEEMEHDV